MNKQNCEGTKLRSFEIIEKSLSYTIQNLFSTYLCQVF